MKESTNEKKMKENFLPGKITKEGFLGSDDRHIHDIISHDKMTLDQYNISADQIARELQNFIEEGKKGLENKIIYKNYEIQIVWSRGMLPSPFGDRPLQFKITAYVTDLETKESLKFTQLSVFMIQTQGFFGGIGSSSRIDPDKVIHFLRLKEQ